MKKLFAKKPLLVVGLMATSIVLAQPFLESDNDNTAAAAPNQGATPTTTAAAPNDMKFPAPSGPFQSRDRWSYDDPSQQIRKRAPSASQVRPEAQENFRPWSASERAELGLTAPAQKPFQSDWSKPIAQPQRQPVTQPATRQNLGRNTARNIGPNTQQANQNGVPVPAMTSAARSPAQSRSVPATNPQQQIPGWEFWGEDAPPIAAQIETAQRNTSRSRGWSVPGGFTPTFNAPRMNTPSVSWTTPGNPMPSFGPGFGGYSQNYQSHTGPQAGPQAGVTSERNPWSY